MFNASMLCRGGVFNAGAAEPLICPPLCLFSTLVTQPVLRSVKKSYLNKDNATEGHLKMPC